MRSQPIRRHRSLLVIGLAVIASCAHPTPEQQVMNDAAEALGGRQRLLNLHAMAMEGDGRQFNLGQDVRPDAADQTFSLTGLTYRQDLTAKRARVEQTRTPN